MLASNVIDELIAERGETIGIATTTSTTSGGKRQERYAVIAEVRGDGKPMQLFKFVNKETFDRLDVPELN